MFISKLLSMTALAKMSFDVESKDGNIIFTVMPKQTAPEATGVVAQAHAALSMPLRVSVEDNDEADNKILAELGSYLMKRNSLQSNLDILNKTMADATKSVKQEVMEKEGGGSGKASESKSNDSEKQSTPVAATEPKKLEL